MAVRTVRFVVVSGSRVLLWDSGPLPYDGSGSVIVNRSAPTVPPGGYALTIVDDELVDDGPAPVFEGRSRRR